MKGVPGWTDDSLLEIEVAFVRCKQVAAAVGRDLIGKLQRVTNLIIYRNPTRSLCARAATFGAVLNVDLAVLFGLTLQARKVGQNGLT